MIFFPRKKVVDDEKALSCNTDCWFYSTHCIPFYETKVYSVYCILFCKKNNTLMYSCWLTTTLSLYLSPMIFKKHTGAWNTHNNKKATKNIYFKNRNFFHFFFPSYHRYFRVRIRSKSKSFFESIKNCVRFQSFVYVNLLFKVFFGVFFWVYQRLCTFFSLLCTLIYSSKCSLVPIVVCPFYVFFKCFLYTLSSQI